MGFYDVLRFVNWLNNGQPSGAQDANTTENGAYAITAVGIANNSIARNPDAKIFLPTENEWYKAAYYDSSSASYFDYPAGSDAQVMCGPPGGSNTANCRDFIHEIENPVNVGSYASSPSPYGTLDQAGNVLE